MTLSPFEILNVPPNASDIEIRRAFKALALKFHPDRHAHNPELAKHRFALLKDAYERIKTAQDRTHYERWITTHAEGRPANTNTQTTHKQKRARR